MANECAAILAILDRLSITGALIITIDAIATHPTIAQAISDKGADDVLALKRNQPTLHDEIAAYFNDPATTGLRSVEVVDKDHGRIEIRTTSVSHDVAWMTGDRRHPGEHRFPGLACMIKAVTQVERHGKVTRDTRYFISSATLSPERAAEAIRSHWASRAFTGCSTSSSRKISRACVVGTAPPTWRSSAASPSTSSGPEKANAPSKPQERPQHGKLKPRRTPQPRIALT